MSRKKERSDSTQLLQEGEGDDLRAREPLEPLVALPVGVEQRVGIVDEAEEDGEALFRSGEPLGMVELGHLLLLREGRLRWPPFYSESAQHTSSAVKHATQRSLTYLSGRRIHPSAWKVTAC